MESNPSSTSSAREPMNGGRLESLRRSDKAPASPERRMGIDVVERRRHLENRPQKFGAGKKWIPLQMFEPLMDLCRAAMERLGVYTWSAQRAAKVDVIYRSVFLPGLPEDLVGLKILHLSDLHIDGVPGFGRQLAEIVKGLDFDVTCITGDLRLSTNGSSVGALNEMTPLVAALAARAPIFAVLGNHDVFDMVAPLEAEGVRYLLNESQLFPWRGVDLYFAGVDDAHYFGTDDLHRAMSEIPVDAPVVLLAHSPDLITEAAEEYVKLYLCGHTHGGQLCLPGGRPIISNANCSRRFSKGAWRLGAMAGYTSKGVGFSGLPLRTFCRAEVVVHVLQKERRRRGRLAAEASVGKV